MRTYIDIIENMENMVGPVQVKGYDEDSRKVTLSDGTVFVLGDNVKDTPTPGYNYAFVVKKNTAIKLLSLTVDIIIHDGENILLIKRKNNPYAGYWALPGGFIDPGEKSEAAARRELEEETGVSVGEYNLKFVGVFDTPNRDPRMENVVSYAYIAKIPQQRAQAGDDASAAEWVPIESIKNLELAFDHKSILDKSRISRL